MHKNIFLILYITLVFVQFIKNLKKKKLNQKNKHVSLLSKGGIVGKNASARVKRRIKNKFVRAIRRVEAQELSREQYFRDRKKNKSSESDRNKF